MKNLSSKVAAIFRCVIQNSRLIKCAVCPLDTSSFRRLDTSSFRSPCPEGLATPELRYITPEYSMYMYSRYTLDVHDCVRACASVYTYIHTLRQINHIWGKKRCEEHREESSHTP
jgi:hypothetical protein